MSKDYSYINDYIVYNSRMFDPVSAPYYNKIRYRAFSKLKAMLLNNV